MWMPGEESLGAIWKLATPVTLKRSSHIDPVPIASPPSKRKPVATLNFFPLLRMHLFVD